MSQEAPNNLICPITCELFKDPVVSADGHTYERVAILKHFCTKNTSPLTNNVLPHTNLVTNFRCKSQCIEWREQQTNDANKIDELWRKCFHVKLPVEIVQVITQMIVLVTQSDECTLQMSQFDKLKPFFILTKTFNNDVKSALETLLITCKDKNRNENQDVLNTKQMRENNKASVAVSDDKIEDYDAKVKFTKIAVENAEKKLPAAEKLLEAALNNMDKIKQAIADARNAYDIAIVAQKKQTDSYINGTMTDELSSISIHKNQSDKQQMKLCNIKESACAKYCVDLCNSLPRIRTEFGSSDPAVQLKAVGQVRQMLSKEEPPHKEVVEAGLVPLLVNFLGPQNSTKLQFEAAWALTNIASSDMTKVIVEHNAIPPLVTLLHSSFDAAVREQSLWCIGNIAGDCTLFRDTVLNTEGALESILINIKNPDNVSILRNAVWTVSNLCRGKPSPPIESLLPTIGVLFQCLKYDDAEVLADTSWALSYVTDGSDERIEAVIDTGCAGRLVQLLAHKNLKIVTPCLRTVGNIVSGNDTLTEEIVKVGALNALQQLLNHAILGIRKEAYWAISNIAGGSKAQVAAVCGNRNLLQQVINVMKNDQPDVASEAAWVISNIFTSTYNSFSVRRGRRRMTKFKTMKLIVDIGLLDAISRLISTAHPKCISTSLDIISALLKYAFRVEECDFDLKLDEIGVVEKLKELQNHADDEEIFDKARNLLDKYFPEVQEDEGDKA